MRTMTKRGQFLEKKYYDTISSVASLGGGGGPPRVTPFRGRGDTRRKKLWAKFTKNSGKTRSDR